MGLQDCLKKTSQMDFKGGASFWNDVLLSIKKKRFKGSTSIILSCRLIPLVEEHGVIIPRKVQYLIFKLSSIVKVGIMVFIHKTKLEGVQDFGKP
jgi:hypothetical protein